MKNLYRLLSAFCIAAAGLCACTRMAEPEALNHSTDGVVVDFTISCEDMSSTRSVSAPPIPNTIKNLNFWVYRAGSLLSAYSFYKDDFDSESALPVTFPSASESYSVYLFANVGRISPPVREADLRNVAYTVSSYSSFRTAGFPMAESLLGYVPKDGTKIRITRLVGQYDISLANSSDKISYTVKSVQLAGCARVVRPFGTLDGFDGYASKAKSTSEVLSSGDALSTADISALNAGRSVTLYFLENCQGRLLPGNTTQHGKNAEAVSAVGGNPGLLTYIEVQAAANTPTADYSGITYRSYLGQDELSDFSIRRSTRYSLKLNFKSDMVSTVDWFVEPGTPDIKRHLFVTASLPCAATNLSSREWDKSACPDCGAPWGGDDFHLVEVTGSEASRMGGGVVGTVWRPACSCGWQSTSAGLVRELYRDGVSSLALYDFLTVTLYVVSDLACGDTFKIYFKSTGTAQGNGFTLTKSAIGPVQTRIDITDNNPTALTLPGSTDDSVKDVLVVESYDGLIRHEVPVSGSLHAVPLGVAVLPSESALSPATAVTHGVRVFSGTDYRSPARYPLSFTFEISGLMYKRQPLSTNSYYNYYTTDWYRYTADRTREFPISGGYYDLTLGLPNGGSDTRPEWGYNMNNSPSQGNYVSGSGFLAGKLRLKSVSALPPYSLRPGYSYKLGIVNSFYYSLSSYKRGWTSFESTVPEGYIFNGAGSFRLPSGSYCSNYMFMGKTSVMGHGYGDAYDEYTYGNMWVALELYSGGGNYGAADGPVKLSSKITDGLYGNRCWTF